MPLTFSSFSTITASGLFVLALRRIFVTDRFGISRGFGSAASSKVDTVGLFVLCSFSKLSLRALSFSASLSSLSLSSTRMSTSDSSGSNSTISRVNVVSVRLSALLSPGFGGGCEMVMTDDVDSGLPVSAQSPLKAAWKNGEAK